MAAKRADRSASIGGDLALALCNTVSWRPTAEPIDHLGDYLDWLGWCERNGAATKATVAALADAGRRRPADAADAFDHAIEARTLLTAVFDPLARGTAPARTDLEELRREYLDALGEAELAGDGEGPRITWPATGTLDAPLRPVIAAGWALLFDPQRARLAICAGEGCGSLFLDRSRNGSRRWCSSGDCGRRERVRRHRAAAKR